VHHYYSQDLSLHHEDDAARWLLRQVTAIEPQLIIVDPWRNHLPGDENSAQDTLWALDIVAQLRDASGAAVLLLHHLNKAGGQSGSRALVTRADVLVEGSDEAEPWYTTRGRTLRRGDAIGRRFTVRVEHENDEDDAIAKTRVGLRFEGDNVTRASLSRTALRVREALASATGPLGNNDLRRLTKISNGREVAKALSEPSSTGIARRDDGKRWSLRTAEFFRELGKENDQ
jgi:AAA domain